MVIRMGQNHFTVSFPLKSPADAKAVAEELSARMPELFRANDTYWHGSLLALHRAERKDPAVPR